MIKLRKNKSRFLLIGSFLILIGICTYMYKYYNNYRYEKADEDRVLEFFDKSDDTIVSSEEVKEEVKEESTTSNYSYTGVLEIPSISFKRGFLKPDDINNNLNKNIEVLQNSDMPNVENGLLAIAGHSGTGRIAFFKKLHKLKVADPIYIYYENIKYKYEVVSIYEVEKNGIINVARIKEHFTLVLTTCSMSNPSKQLVVISKLIEKIEY